MPSIISSIIQQQASDRITHRNEAQQMRDNAANPPAAAGLSGSRNLLQPPSTVPLPRVGTPQPAVTPPPPTPVIQAVTRPVTLPTPPASTNPLPQAQGPSASLANPPAAPDFRAKLKDIRTQKRELLARGRKAAVHGATPAEMRALVEAHRQLRGEERFFQEMDSDGDGIPDAREALDQIRAGNA